MPVAASAIYFLNLRGDVLINRLYRDDVGVTCEDMGESDKPKPHMQILGFKAAIVLSGKACISSS
ncbi:ap-2 complex subunit mu [Phtheirospermum japonicum]|uniref:Ap-2 complex subunit mu n=1 Tax=Phtheirospermum japonicum TaxID=374723 RepID=A0A830D2A4_9LAMI|nr:ap-2 complex subunit mu [Phtheirospermum japonicum]